jgi:hypothetical protein
MPGMRVVLAFGLLLAALALPSTALAASKEPPTDPLPGSPSEAVYGIQVDRARRDAAPGGRSGQASRSEQGVGTSSIVPGTPKEKEAGGIGAPPEGGDRSGPAVVILLILVAGVALGAGFVATRAVRGAA